MPHMKIPTIQKIAASLNNCASVYKAIGEHGKALENYIMALNIITKLYGEESSETMVIYLNLISLYEKMGDEEKAKEYSDKYLIVQAKSRDDYSVKLETLA